jgi:hypothetical protein
LLVRFGGVALLPKLLDKVGKDLGLSIGYERLDLSLFGGWVDLWHLDVKKRDAAASR